MKKNCALLNEQKAKILLAGLFLFVPIIILQQPPIEQDPTYHLFKDRSTIFGIVNFWNVISNLPFLLVGLIALYKILITQQLRIIVELKWSYVLLYFGLLLVAFGSAYYHLEPNNQTLLWDRLPMTMSFMALISVLMGEFISIKLGKNLLLPLILVGVSSVLYWYIGELKGQGDLRFYALVQFIPILSIPIILGCFKSNFNSAFGYWWLLFAYVVAKLLEHYDSEVHNLLAVISGHSLKHMMAALGMYLLLCYFDKRELVSERVV